MGLSGRVVWPNDLIFLFAQIEFDEVDHGLTYDAIIQTVFAPDHAQMLAPDEFALQIQRTGENQLQIGGEPGRNISLVQGRIYGTFDLCFGSLTHGLEFRRQHTDGRRFSKNRLNIDPVVNFQRCQERQSILLEFEVKPMARLQFSEIEFGPDRIRHDSTGGGIEARLGKEDVKAFPGAYDVGPCDMFFVQRSQAPSPLSEGYVLRQRLFLGICFD
ncbi:hypothetical protein DZK27_15445 [Rhodobacteraceae bacterium 63075]|nr:hypothetical protein DZK27_15445 [Rhodobacteraceae bacterium 63075]